MSTPLTADALAHERRWAERGCTVGPGTVLALLDMVTGYQALVRGLARDDIRVWETQDGATLAWSWHYEDEVGEPLHPDLAALLDAALEADS